MVSATVYSGSNPLFCFVKNLLFSLLVIMLYFCAEKVM